MNLEGVIRKKVDACAARFSLYSSHNNDTRKKILAICAGPIILLPQSSEIAKVYNPCYDQYGFLETPEVRLIRSGQNLGPSSFDGNGKRCGTTQPDFGSAAHTSVYDAGGKGADDSETGLLGSGNYAGCHTPRRDRNDTPETD